MIGGLCRALGSERISNRSLAVGGIGAIRRISRLGRIALAEHSQRSQPDGGAPAHQFEFHRFAHAGPFLERRKAHYLRDTISTSHKPHHTTSIRIQILLIFSKSRRIVLAVSPRSRNPIWQISNLSASSGDCWRAIPTSHRYRQEP